MSKQGIYLLGTMILLIFVGIIMIYSASAIYADQYFDDSMYFLKRQIIYFFMGLILCFGAYCIHPDILERHSRVIMLFSILLLVLVYVPFLSREASGARRWLRIAQFNFQPAEFSKIALVLYFSAFLKRKIVLMRRGSFIVLLPPLFILSLLSILIVLQPDLGSVILLFFVTAILFFVAGIRYRYIVAFFLVCSIFFYFAVIKVPYRMDRIYAFMDPWRDSQGTGFQIIQSFLAFGLGGLRGVGLGSSTQKLFYLPQAYTDFIYSIIAEEGGLMASSAVIVLYMLLFIQGVLIGIRQMNLFRRMVAFSLCVLIIFQAILNIFVAMGLIPTKGLPLPFISFGGSSLIVNMIAIGIILSIDRSRDY
ncbi:putative lipid II flippase FtsW [Candidatus Omnitrophota bacterium]